MQEVEGRASQGFGGAPESNGAEGLKDEVGQRAHRATEEVRSVAERGKQKLAESAEGVTSALRHASDGMREDEHEELARYTGVVADKLEQLTSTLKNRDVHALLTDVERFAKRQPALFLGGAFTAGLIAARFFKTSSPRPRADTGVESADVPAPSGVGPGSNAEASKGAL